VDQDAAVLAQSRSHHLRPLLLGHRGARRRVPENTFVAFDKALRDGCDGFEFDVRLSSDGRGVVCHDPTLYGLEIAQSGFSDLLAACTVKSKNRFGRDTSSHDTHQLHCLEDVLAKYAECAFLDIELKTEGLEEATIGLLARFPAKRGAVVSSFLPEVLRKLAILDGESQARKVVARVGAETLPLGFIFDSREAMRQWDRLPVSHLMPRHDVLDRRLVNEFHAAGKQVFAWTVNRERRMRFLTELGVDALISDDPELLASFRKGLIP
jgi:glycerophosphoryl diester phosphodiesterase